VASRHGSASRGPQSEALGRPQATSHAALESAALDLFRAQGYAATTVDEIAEAVGVSRRTFFRYFPVKADVVWGDFAALVDEFRRSLAAVTDDTPMLTAIRETVVAFNRVPDPELPHHRQRMEIILGEPEVIARSTRWYALWRRPIVEFAARRLGQPIDGLLPRTVGHCCLGASLAAYEQWLHGDDARLETYLGQSFRALEDGLAVGEGRAHNRAIGVADRSDLDP